MTTFSKMTGNLSEGFRILIYPKVFLDKKTCQFFLQPVSFFSKKVKFEIIRRFIRKKTETQIRI